MGIKPILFYKVHGLKMTISMERAGKALRRIKKIVKMFPYMCLISNGMVVVVYNLHNQHQDMVLI
jgi:hypothetical protein